MNIWDTISGNVTCWIQFSSLMEFMIWKLNILLFPVLMASWILPFKRMVWRIDQQKYKPHNSVVNCLWPILSWSCGYIGFQTFSHTYTYQILVHELFKLLVDIIETFRVILKILAYWSAVYRVEELSRPDLTSPSWMLEIFWNWETWLQHSMSPYLINTI